MELSEAQQLRAEAFAIEQVVEDMRGLLGLTIHQKKMMADLASAASRFHAIADLSNREDMVALNAEIDRQVTKYMAETKAQSKHVVVNECLRNYFGAM